MSPHLKRQLRKLILVWNQSWFLFQWWQCHLLILKYFLGCCSMFYVQCFSRRPVHASLYSPSRGNWDSGSLKSYCFFFQWWQRHLLIIENFIIILLLAKSSNAMTIASSIEAIQHVRLIYSWCALHTSRELNVRPNVLSKSMRRMISFTRQQMKLYLVRNPYCVFSMMIPPSVNHELCFFINNDIRLWPSKAFKPCLLKQGLIKTLKF